MPKRDTGPSKATTPVDVVQKSNPLIKEIAQVSKKWHKRWPKIDQPWPVEGTLNLKVIKTLQVHLKERSPETTKFSTMLL